MTTITIAYEVSAAKFAEIEALIDNEAIHNVNHNGEAFSIERGDFTTIDKDDAEHVILLDKINNIIGF